GAGGRGEGGRDVRGAGMTEALRPALPRPPVFRPRQTASRQTPTTLPAQTFSSPTPLRPAPRLLSLLPSHRCRGRFRSVAFIAFPQLLTSLRGIRRRWVAIAQVKDLIEAGVHCGPRASRWNPKMRPYIYGKRNLIHIIDLRETVRGLLRAYRFLA